jgi:hypothetical protein
MTVHRFGWKGTGNGTAKATAKGNGKRQQQQQRQQQVQRQKQMRGFFASFKMTLALMTTVLDYEGECQTLPFRALLHCFIR